MEVTQPAAKMLVELSKSQDIVAGDGTTTGTVLYFRFLSRQWPSFFRLSLHCPFVTSHARSLSLLTVRQAARDCSHHLLYFICSTLRTHDSPLATSAVPFLLLGSGDSGGGLVEGMPGTAGEGHPPHNHFRRPAQSCRQIGRGERTCPVASDIRAFQGQGLYLPTKAIAWRPFAECGAAPCGDSRLQPRQLGVG